MVFKLFVSQMYCAGRQSPCQFIHKEKIMQVGDNLRHSAPLGGSEHETLDLEEHHRLGREWAHEAGALWLIGADAAIRRAAHAIAGWFGRA
jgi:hypothetical protein